MRAIDQLVNFAGPDTYPITYLFDAAEQQVLDGVKSDGPESDGVSDGRVDLREREGWNGASDP